MRNQKQYAFLLALAVLGSTVFPLLPSASLSGTEVFAPATDSEAEELIEEEIFFSLPEEREKDRDLEEYLQSHEAPYDVLLFYETAVGQEEELRAQAEQEQDATLALLEEGVQRGAVEEYESYYLVNAVHAVIRDEALLEEIYALEEVTGLEENALLRAPAEPVRSQKSSGGVAAFAGEEDTARILGWGVSSMQADKVWDTYHLDGSGVTVGIMDSGVNYELPALKHAYLGYDATTDSFDHSYYKDFTGKNVGLNHGGNNHGTMVVASLAGKLVKTNASGAKETYYYGTAPGARFINAKVIHDKEGNMANVLAGAQWMLEQDPDIINNSWGTPKEVDGQVHTAIQAMLANWEAAGIVVIFAAGNHTGSGEAADGSIAYPARLPGVFSVGAVRQNMGIWWKSQRGPSRYTADIKPDVVAPGQNVDSISYRGAEVRTSGTSFAAPMVAGVVALMKQADADLGPAEIYRILRETAKPLTDAKYTASPNMAYGYGIVDAYAAVGAVLQQSQTPQEATPGQAQEATPSQPQEVTPVQPQPPQEAVSEPDSGQKPQEVTPVQPQPPQGTVQEPDSGQPQESQQASSAQPLPEKAASVPQPLPDEAGVKENVSKGKTSGGGGSSGGGSSSGGGGSSGGGSARSRNLGEEVPVFLFKQGESSFISKQVLYSARWEKNRQVWNALDEKGEKIRSAWLKLDGKWYALDSTGTMVSDWTKINGIWYYFGKDGAMLSGTWIFDKGSWYYLHADGAMATGWLQDKQKWYYLEDTGAMLQNTQRGGDYFDAEGVWLKR